MRAALAGAVTPHPLASLLPAVYLEDGFTQRLCTALDELLATFPLTLDSLPAYLDPDTAPDDLLDWLAQWVALPSDGTADADEQRRRIRGASELHRARGTAQGLRAALRLALPDTLSVELVEGGGTDWSPVPGSDLPGTGASTLVVLLGGPGAEAALRRADAVVALVKPAHVPHRTDVVPG